jgi:hypothetical protein
MYINRAIRAILLSFLIVLGSITFLSSPIVSASDSGQRTELYFTEYNTLISTILFGDEDMGDLEDVEDDFFGEDMFGNLTSQMSVFRPAEEEESVWPPSLFTTDKIIRELFNILSDIENIDNITDSVNPNFIEFGIMWAIYNNPEIIKNFTQDDPFLGSIIEKIDFELINPFRINQDFSYKGNESVELNGKIIFDLYLESYEKLRQLGVLRQDYIKVVFSKTQSLFGFPVISNELKNVTVPIQRSGLLKRNSIIKQQIEMDLSNESVLINPGDTLRFSVELIPHDRAFTLLNHWHNKGYGSGDWLENRAEKLQNKIIPLRQNIGKNISIILDTIKETLNETIGADIEDIITLEDVSDIIDGYFGSSFLFASSSYPSRIILPVDLTVEDENIKTFYLHEGTVMDEKAPQNDIDKSSRITSEPLQWNSSSLPRNKILKQATAALFINFRNLRVLPKNIPNIMVSLISGDKILANESFKLTDRLLKDPTEPIMITFDNINEEIFYGDTIGLKISNLNQPDRLNLGLSYQINLFYDSFDYPSSITISFDETDNIQFEIDADPKDEYIIPGGEMTYTLEVSSVYDDDIYLDISDSKRGQWSYSIVEDMPVNISAGETKTITVIAKSENNMKEAYGDYLDLTFEVNGKTGYEKKTATVVVDPAAIEYDIGIIGQEKRKDIKKGSSGTFYFIVENKNTGAVDDEDSYSIHVTSKNNWEIRYTDSTPRLRIGEKTEQKRVFVRVNVPKNTTFTSDVITFTVTSNENPSVSKSMNVTVNVKQISMFEYLYDVFDSAAKKIGIDDMFGSQAAYALMGGGVLLILLLIIVVIFLLKKKYVKIICNNRILEIDPAKEAIFTFILYNPTRKTRMYKISSQIKSDPSKWTISPDIETISLSALSKQEFTIVVKADQLVKPKDWAEISISVEVVGKSKKQDISAMVMIKEGKPILRIKDVFTWPKVFDKGDRMITSCIVENKGSISARNIEVVLLINRKQKNKVQVTIPPGGFADIKIPWIALKGKNDVELKIKE